MPSIAPLAPALLTSLGLAVLVGGSAAAASITGVCPDGSIFIVQRAESIPCARAKLVEPHEIPPVRPELLPNPYTWQVYNEGASPNNPYNLIDEARKVRSLSSEGVTPPPPTPTSEGSSPAPRATVAALREAVLTIRHLLAGDTVSLGVTQSRLRNPSRRPPAWTSRSSSAPEYVPQKWHCSGRAPSCWITCSRANPSHDAPTLGCPARCCPPWPRRRSCWRPVILPLLWGPGSWMPTRVATAMCW